MSCITDGKLEPAGCYESDAADCGCEPGEWCNDCRHLLDTDELAAIAADEWYDASRIFTGNL